MGGYRRHIDVLLGSKRGAVMSLMGVTVNKGTVEEKQPSIPASTCPEPPPLPLISSPAAGGWWSRWDAMASGQLGPGVRPLNVSGIGEAKSRRACGSR